MIFVLYDDDEDGFCACYAAQLKLGTTAQYIAVNRGDPPPDMPDATDVIILDFNYSRDVMQTLAERCRVVLIDHHVSAAIELVGLPYCHFDTSKSAAVLSWEYFWPDQPVPTFMLYVQDQDLWKWSLPYSKEIRCAVQSHDRDYDTWKRISGISIPRSPETEYNALNALVTEGVPIQRYVQQQLKQIKPRQAIFILEGSPRISFDFEEAQSGEWRFVVPVINATMLHSEICNNLLVEYPNAQFVASYYDGADGLRHWGLRSRPEGTDVSLIAKMFGGGGHKRSAGFMTYHDASYGNPAAPSPIAAMSAEEKKPPLTINIENKTGPRRWKFVRDENNQIIEAESIEIGDQKV